MNRYEDPLNKWVFRSNARRKMQFGVHEPASKAFSTNGGESWLRYHSVDMQKAMIRDNIETLKLMRSERFIAYRSNLRAYQMEFYRTSQHLSRLG